jgi:two-component system, response regulator / RNA-binding antiterminator
MSAVLLVHDDAPHAATLRRTLESLRYQIAAELPTPAGLHAEVVRLAPDLIVVCTQSPTIALLGALHAVADSQPRPVVIFASDARRDTIREAVDAGVAAYVVAGWAPERVTPIIEAACARFEAHQAIKRELASTRNKLSERKIIEKAKGIVMQQRRLSENDAYAALRTMAMQQNLALAEVARRVIAVASLLA